MTDPARKLPIGIQSFTSLREDGYLYVDKTAYIHLLVSTGKQYFLSRPRRFGKSLFLSTLRAYWEGRKELFEGLAIMDVEREWASYPVFYFDFNGQNYLSDNALEEVLSEHLKRWERQYALPEQPPVSLGERFRDLLIAAKEQTGRRCVVLVDEYDKPLLEVVEHQEAEEHNKAVFKGFFSTLKSFDDYLQFVMITGVTKFSKVSIFSDLNQLEDISFVNEYAGICGITKEELQNCFQPEIHAMSVVQQLSDERCMSQLEETYDGYHFSPDSLGIFNPFSLLNALKRKELRYYWFETGTPSFLVKRVRQLQLDVRQFDESTLLADGEILSDYQADNPDIVPLLYQTGYLTIHSYDRAGNYYQLGFPNKEVRYGFLKSLIPEYLPDVHTGSGKDILSIKRYLETAETEQLENAITALFAGIPYESASQPLEHYFQTVLYLIFTLLGQYVHCEVHSFQGRADCIVETNNYIYLFEFKRDKSADEALQQIEEKGYALPYAADPRTLYKIGVNFDSASRMLTEWKVVS